MSDTIYITFLWHQHQPNYADPETGRLALPWVRLHAVKDYVDMALLAERYEFKQTVNLVPSLIEQLEGYASDTLTDDALELSRKPAADLTEADRRILLERFFDANEPTMIRPHPRYLELARERRNTPKTCLTGWTDAEWRDLQVWFNLSWMDPLWTESAEDISHELVTKGRDFSEDEKAALLDRHRELCGDVVMVHRRLQDEGLIEVTVSPYAHPILPLLCDTNVMRQCQPTDPMPRPPFQYPQDADRHVGMAVELYKKHFGSAPRGMWPSEGSVSEQALNLIAAHGLNWCATDEAIVSGSNVEIEGVRHPSGADPYRPYSMETEQGELRMIFRDHELSDHIGFHYFTTPPREAADHFLQRLITKVRGRIPRGPAVAPVILDGENCWEHFPNDGHDFLDALIRGIAKRPELKPLTVSEMLETFPAKRVGRIRKLKPGSWINGNYRIWIGGSEENAAWELLRRVREDIEAVSSATQEESAEGPEPAEDSESPATEQQPEKAPDFERAFHRLCLAEGSDWFWWYGDTNNSDHDAFYDALFRGHLRQARKHAGLDPMPELETPIWEQAEPTSEEELTGQLFAPPRLERSPHDFFAWLGAIPLEGGAGGAMHEVATREWSAVLGWCGDRAYLRLNLDTETRMAVVRGKNRLTWRFDPGEEYEIQVMRFATVEVSTAPISHQAREIGYAEIEVLLYEGDRIIDRLPGHSKAVLNVEQTPTWLV